MSTLLSKPLLLTLGVLVLLSGGIYGAYSYVSLHSLKSENSALEARLAEMQAEREDLLSKLADASTTLAEFNVQLGDISSTVGSLQKRVETDPELLRKYSKVYFLNENYVPKGLIDIDPSYAYNGKKFLFLSQAYPFLSGVVGMSSEAGLHLLVESAYRSYGEQSGLKSSYTVRYGAGTANSFSADQGYSEHQLGTAVDFTTEGLKGALTGFDKTPEYAWLQENAYKYGFILSYPTSNGYYIYEPWHWRFVGIALATRLHEERETFYSLEQRQIDPYLVKLFEPGS